MKIFFKVFIFSTVLLFTSFISVHAGLEENKPLVGKYEVVHPFTIELCSGSIRGTCVQKEIINYVVGKTIDSDRSFYDNDTKSWSIGWMGFSGEEISIPLSNVKKISDTIQIIEETKNTIKETKPLTGKYEVISPFSIEGCVKYVGEGIAGGTCLETSTTNFKIGDVIYSHNAFYNSDSSVWDIGIEIYGQYRSVLLSNVNKISDKTPITLKKGQPMIQLFQTHYFFVTTGLIIFLISIFLIYRKKKYGNKN